MRRSGASGGSAVASLPAAASVQTLGQNPAFCELHKSQSPARVMPARSMAALPRLARHLGRFALRASALPLRPSPLLSCRSLSSPAAPLPPPLHPPLTEAQFHALADATLEALELGVTALEEAVPGFDLSHAMGVLTLRLGDKGTYVLNKQAPNRQIWWSSPVSGPRRYAWDAQARAWVNTRDGHRMLEALEAELVKLLGAPVRLRWQPE
jgi:frataxin